MIQITEDQLAQDLLDFIPPGAAKAAAAAIAEKRGATKAEAQKPRHRVTARGVKQGNEDKFPTYGTGGHLWPKAEPATFDLTDDQLKHAREQEAAGYVVVLKAERIDAPQAQPQQQNRR